MKGTGYPFLPQPEREASAFSILTGRHRGLLRTIRKGCPRLDGGSGPGFPAPLVTLSWPDLVQVPAPLLSTCVTLKKPLNLSAAQLLYLLEWE